MISAAGQGAAHRVCGLRRGSSFSSAPSS